MTIPHVPAPAEIPTIDTTRLCHDGPMPDPPVGSQVVLINDLYRVRDSSELGGTWDLPDGAIVTLDGMDAIIGLVSGSVTVWACGLPLIFDTVQGDNQFFQAAANSGIQLDAATTRLVYLEITQSGGTVSLRADSASRLDIDINTTSAHGSICASASCWGLDDYTKISEPIRPKIRQLVNQPEICIRNHCIGP